MTRPRRRSRRAAEQINLTWHGVGDGSIRRPDSRWAAPHTLPVELPDREQLRMQVRARIDDLHARGALDEGSYDVLDQVLDDLRRQVEAAIRTEARGRENVASRLLAIDVEHHGRESLRLAHHLASLAEVRAELGAWRAELSGSQHESTRTEQDTPVLQQGLPPLPGADGCGPLVPLPQTNLDRLTGGHLRPLDSKGA